MRRLSVALFVAFVVFIGVSWAAPTILSPSYTNDGNDIKIYRTDNSDGGYVDLNVQNPTTNDRVYLGTVKISDQSFIYTKQREGNQKLKMIPNDGGDEVQITIETNTSQPKNVTRTVIPSVPQTGPSINILGIIIATFVIFGGYIYIKRRADI